MHSDNPLHFLYLFLKRPYICLHEHVQKPCTKAALCNWWLSVTGIDASDDVDIHLTILLFWLPGFHRHYQVMKSWSWCVLSGVRSTVWAVRLLEPAARSVRTDTASSAGPASWRPPATTVRTFSSRQTDIRDRPTHQQITRAAALIHLITHPQQSLS